MTADTATKAKLEAVVQTDVGVVRDHNEDAAHADEHGRFFIVADGMGGHAAGEVASSMAVETVRKELIGVDELLQDFAKQPSDAGRKRIIEALERAVRNAHQAVYDRGVKETDKQGMGTTLDVLLVVGGDAFVAHVGDSRTYLIRDGKAAQITTDHTVAEVLVIEGKLSVEEAAASPLRTILVNAIGVAADVGVEMAHLKLQDGDYFLLCSDGLHDYFPTEQELADYATKDEGIEEALNELVDAAKERGGHDNITGILVAIESAPNIPDVEGADEPDEDASAVPSEIARDDTVPVDVDELIKAEEAKRERDLALATTGEHVVVETGDGEVDGEAPTGEVEAKDSDHEDEDDSEGADDDADEGGDESDGSSKSTGKGKGSRPDLKTTVPIRALSAAEKSSKKSDLKTTVPIRPTRGSKKAKSKDGGSKSKKSKDDD